MRTRLKRVVAGSVIVVAASVTALVVLLSPTEIHTVDHVIDGDTIVVHDQHGESLRVQLLGVDAPEPGSEIPFENCGSEQAKQYLESELPAGTPVQLRTGGTTIDDQGQLLAMVFRTKNQASVNELVTAQGHGIAVSNGGDTEWLDAVKKREGEAKAAHRGIHDPQLSCTPAAAVARINNDAQSYSPADIGSMSDEQLARLIGTADKWIAELDTIQGLPQNSLALQMAGSIPADEFNRLRIRTRTIRTRAADEQGKRIKEAARAAEQARAGE